MKKWLCVVLAFGYFVSGIVSGQPSLAPERPVVRDLGNDRYMIGKIELKKQEGRFALPGVIIDVGSPDAPIEFLAIIEGSEKSYESLIGLDANAFEFNLACLLIGLDSERATRSRHRFDPRPVVGDSVGISLSWDQNGERVERSLGELLLVNGKSSVKDNWVYTGSMFHQGQFLAQISGILIGFVHDPESILQHRQGIGVGEYGAVTYNPEVLPPPGTNVRLDVWRLGDSGPSQINPLERGANE